MRQEKRRNLLYYLEVKLNQEEVPDTRLVDISLKGLLLMSREPLKTVEVTGEIIFPDSKIFEHVNFTFSGKIRWSKKENKTNIYYSGVEFSETIPQHDRIISYIINQIGFSDGEKKIRDNVFQPEFY